MFRSLTSLMLLANPTAATNVEDFAVPAQIEFDESTLLEVNLVPTLKEGAVAPAIEAKAALIMDVDTGIVLYEKNADQALPMASLTKIMAATIILENHDLDEIVTIPSNYAGLEGVRIWLGQGEELTIESLLKATLIRSAGDATLALAEHHSGSVEAFVEEMNLKAEEMNLLETHFVNPVGLDDEGHLSSARDLAELSRYAMQDSDFRDIVKLQGATIETINGESSYTFDSTNKLLDSYLEILGVKTGTTDNAGECLINLARDENGNEIITVILNSPDRFQENKSMIDWAFRSYQW